jgi:type I restriction enzyme, S subunit
MGKGLPHNWVEERFSELTSFVIGGDWGKDPEEVHQDETELVACIRGSEIKNWDKEKGRTASFRKIKPNSKEKRSLIEGDILLEISGGGPDQPVGRTIYIDREALGTNADYAKVCTNFLRLVRFHDCLDKKFIKHYLDSFYLSGEIVKYQGGSNNLRNLKYKEFESINIPIPPLPEQQRIVAKLDGLFAHLEEVKNRLAKVPELLKQFRQSVLTQAVSGEMVGVNEMKQLGDFEIDIKTGPFGSALHKSDYISDGIPVINPSHIKAGNILPNHEVSIDNIKAKELSRWYLNDNEVIIGRRGEMGRAAKYQSAFGPMICGTGSLVLKPSALVSSDFLTYYLRSPFCVSYLEQNSVGSTMINLNQKILKSLPFPNMSFEQQKTAIEKVEDLFSKADAIEGKYKLLKEKIDNLPQAILAKAFKGELVEQLPTDGSAMELLEEIKKLTEETKKKK